MAKKPKRMSKKELKAPDEFEVALNRTWDRLVQYRVYLIAGVVAFVVIGVAWAVIESAQKSSVNERIDRLDEALSPILAPVAEEGEEKAPEGAYPDRKSAFAAADTKLAEFIEEYGDSDEAAVARYAEATGKLPQGDAPGAVEALEAWIAANGGSPLVPAALDRLAAAQVDAGDRSGALETYRKLADASDGTLKALALSAAGDLQNPLISPDGNADEARKAYEEAQTALGDRPESDPLDPLAALGEPYLVAELKTKLDSL